MAKPEQAQIAWAPQPGPQAALVKCPVYEVFFGGARGGGKTDAMIGGDWPIHASRYGKHAKGIFFRRELPQLESAIERSKEIYFKLGAQWNEQKKTWIFPNGASLKFRPLERDADAEKYQGHDYTRVYFEELTNYPDPKPVMKIKATLRSGAGVPVGFRATGNPGGPGHLWVKQRYIDPDPNGWKIISNNGLQRVFIPSRLADNIILSANDPNYLSRLQESGSEQLVKAWVDGDWNIVDGAYFDCWSNSKHVLQPFEMPGTWRRFRSGDWGSARPFSFGWWAIVDDWFRTPEGHWLPRGAIVRYREWYGMKPGSPNVGLKLTAEAVGKGIADREKGDSVSIGVLDPAAFSEDGGPSIHERINNGSGRTVNFVKADNARVAGRGAMGGWDMMRSRLKGEDFGEPYGVRPMIYCFSTCVDSIRTLPALQHDEKRPEDIDTDGEDHAADEWRYACMSRPWIPQALKEQKPKHDSYYIEDESDDSWLTA